MEKGDILRGVAFLALIVVGVAGGAATLLGVGVWKTTIGPIGLGLALLLAPAAFHFAFTSSGFSAGYRSRRRNRRVFDPEGHHHFDANHAEGFELDRARHEKDQRPYG